MKSEILKQFGKHVRHLRQLQDLSQETLAEKANMHRTYIGMIERGERNPALLNLIRLASALDISLPELLRTMLMTGTVIMNLTDSYGFFRENVGRMLGDLKLEYQTRFPKFTAEMKINKGGVGQFIEKLIGRDLCKKVLLPTAEIQTKIFGCFCFKYPLILPKCPLNPPQIPDNQASDRLLGANRHT